LNLNLLLSFAQFEREVVAAIRERYGAATRAEKSRILDD
jgi:hypothetical protein